ncbi:hypothetical protein ACFYZI_19690 [Streptomyces griseorubiginosus]|uniref:hypothetical protein n=1 Tax=Streptomyces griseorubiginosus TaxID=67304 RepID=UPI0036C9B667
MEIDFRAIKVARDLELQVELPDRVSIPEECQLSVQLIGYDDISSCWLASFPLNRSYGNCWSGRLVDSVDEDWPHLIEVSQLLPTIESESRHVLDKLMKSGEDYSRHLLLIGDEEFCGPDCAATPEMEMERLKRIQNERANRTLRAPDGGTLEHRIAFMADGVFVTKSLYIPGVALHAVQPSTRGSDIPEIFNIMLEKSGWPSRLDVGQWIAEYSRRRPVVVAVASSVLATSPDSALRYIRERVQSFLNLTSLHRGTEPMLISAIVEVRDPEGNWKPDVAWIDGAPYGGNLMGGDFAGENQRRILSHWDAIAADEKNELWLSLFSDAMREPRWDFKWFRLFNLLETIGLEKYGDATPVIDFQGTPIRKPDPRNPRVNRIVTTKEARGKVYRIVRDASVASHLAESSFCGYSGMALWDVTRTWTDVRNAVAHEGGYRENDPQQNSTSRNRRVNALFATQSKFSYLTGLEEAARRVITGLLDRRI